MTKSTVCKIRPVTWKICVQGEAAMNYVQETLQQAGFEIAGSKEEPGLHNPSVYSFLATPKADTPVNSEELTALLEKDPQIEIAFAGETTTAAAERTDPRGGQSAPAGEPRS
jgi:hypothetical protein